MSHVASVNIQITDLGALKKACAELHLQFMEGQKTHQWFGRWVNDYSAADAAYRNGIKPEDYGKCEHAIRLPKGVYREGDYEIGVVKSPTGSGFTLVYDFYSTGRKIKETLGQRCERIVQLYGVYRATQAAMNKGYMVQRQLLQDGAIKLRITGAGL